MRAMNAIDPHLHSDIFAVDLVSVDQIGPNVRLTFSAPYANDGHAEHIVVAKLVVPKEALSKMARLLVEPTTDITSLPTEDEGEILRH